VCLSRLKPATFLGNDWSGQPASGRRAGPSGLRVRRFVLLQALGLSAQLTGSHHDYVVRTRIQ